MDYAAQAAHYVATTAGDAFGVVEESIVECEKFYAFTYQTVKYLTTRIVSDGAVGQGYIFLDKADGRFHAYGSRRDYDAARIDLLEQLMREARIQEYKPNYQLYKRFDIRINTIKNRKALLDKLIGYISYTTPEVVAGSIYRIPKPYTIGELEQRLKELPTTFHTVLNQEKLILELGSSNCCDFDLLEHTGRSYAKYIDKATDEDLKVIW